MRKAATLILGCLLAASQGIAADICIRPRSTPRGAVVTLGDIADVSAADAKESETLAAAELFPAPIDGRQRVVRLRELQDLCHQRGISLAKHRLSGASQVVVGRAVDEERPTERRPLSSTSAKRAERAVAAAIDQYVQEQTSQRGSWAVAVKLSEAQARAIPTDGRKIIVRGGQAPWSGNQRFEIVVEDAARPASFAVAAEVRTPLLVVTAARSIGRGELIRPADVSLQPAPAGDEQTETFRSVDEVVGAEAIQEITAGTVLQRGVLRSPLMVRRGEVITVYSRTAGIRIRVTARAKEDGSQGDVINVESLLDRKVYSARVSGIQEAEIYARATQAVSASGSEEMPRPAVTLASRGSRSPAKSGATAVRTQRGNRSHSLASSESPAEGAAPASREGRNVR